jgi:hypothetical protein
MALAARKQDKELRAAQERIMRWRKGGPALFAVEALGMPPKWDPDENRRHHVVVGGERKARAQAAPVGALRPRRRQILIPRDLDSVVHELLLPLQDSPARRRPRTSCRTCCGRNSRSGIAC